MIPLRTALRASSPTLIILIGVFFSCNFSQSSRRDFLDEKTMRHVLTDMHLADATINQGYFVPARVDSQIALAKGYRTLILAKYKLKPADFEHSLSYYAAHTDLLDAIYQGMIDSLSQAQLKLQRDSTSGDVLASKERKRKLSENGYSVQTRWLYSGIGQNYGAGGFYQNGLNTALISVILNDSIVINPKYLKHALPGKY